MNVKKYETKNFDENYVQILDEIVYVVYELWIWSETDQLFWIYFDTNEIINFEQLRKKKKVLINVILCMMIIFEIFDKREEDGERWFAIGNRRSVMSSWDRAIFDLQYV